MSFPYESASMEILRILNRQRVEDVFQRADKEDLSYLQSKKVPDSICGFYRNFEPCSCIDIKGIRLWPISELQVENEAAIPGYVINPFGFFVIATTICGDAYCVKTKKDINDPDEAIYIAGHDLIYEGVDENQVQAAIAMVSKSFDEFLNKLISGDLPTSYYELKKKT